MPHLCGRRMSFRSPVLENRRFGVPIPGRNTANGVLVRLAGALLLLPWPASQLSLWPVSGTAAGSGGPSHSARPQVSRSSGDLRSGPRRGPETRAERTRPAPNTETRAEQVQLALMIPAAVTSLVLIVFATAAGNASKRREG